MTKWLLLLLVTVGVVGGGLFVLWPPAPVAAGQPDGSAAPPGEPALAAAPASAAVEAPASATAPASAATAEEPKNPYAGPPLDPSWPKRLYVITDSVVLGAKPALFKSLSDWKITFEGRPALMVKTAVGEIKRSGQMMPPVAVVALGYNSLWEKDRKHFERWAEKFDREAESMIALLTSRGAKKVVWVMLRELTPELVTKKGMRQYKKAAWYFPYVNERLKALCEKHPELALADWPSASQELGLTYDAIHLNTKGAKVMVDVIRAAIGLGPTPPEEKKK